MDDTVVFWHVAQVGDWEGVVREQAERLSAFPRVVVGLLGVEPLRLPGNCAIALRSPSLEAYEHHTLGILHDHCRGADGRVLYLHTKGVSHTREQFLALRSFWAHLGVGSHEVLRANIRQWRRCMEHYLIDRRVDCWDALRDHDLAGVGYQGRPPHYRGNFWWANAGYIRGLPAPTGSRDEAEYWVGRGDPRAANLRAIDHNLYLWGMPWQDYYPIHA